METQQMMELLLSRMDANQETMKTNQDVLLKTVKGIMAKISAKMDAQHKKMMAMLVAHHERTVASLGKMDAKDFKAIPEEMETVTEHEEIPEEDATVMPVGEPRKRRRVCNLAAERSQKMKERTRGKSRFKRKLAAACRKVSRLAKVAWRERNPFRNVQTQRNCGLRKRLTVTGIRTTQKGWTFGKRRRVYPEGSTGVKVPNTRRHRRLKNEKTAGRIFEKTFRLQIAKREDGSSVGSLKIRNWTLWRGRPPPKR
jgi:hypothetical protein